VLRLFSGDACQSCRNPKPPLARCAACDAYPAMPVLVFGDAGLEECGRPPPEHGNTCANAVSLQNLPGLTDHRYSKILNLRMH
jgi:hypothetical protein